MRTEISRTYRIEAAHRLPHVAPEHKCARLHGHSFEITLFVTGPLDDKLDWVIDFADIDRAFAPLFAQLDHHYLNDVPGLENPTSERLARWIAERVRFEGAARLSAVSVAENCNSQCTLRID